MVLVEQLCIHRCQPNGSVQMLWMYHPPVLGSQRNEHTNSVEVNKDKELEPLKNQIALFHGMYGFSSDTRDILDEQNNETSLEHSNGNKSYVYNLFEQFKCISAETTLARKLLIKKPSSDWVPSSRRRNGKFDMIPEEPPSIFLAVTKPCPSAATLILAVTALWSQYQLFYGDEWVSQMNSSDVYEAFDRWWTAKLSPLECGGSILRAMDVIAVGRPLESEQVALLNELYLEKKDFVGSLLLYIPSAFQPHIVYEQGRRLQLKVRNTFIMYCMNECQNLLEGEEYSHFFGFLSSSDLHSAGSENHDEDTHWELSVNCVFRKRQKRILIIRWSRANRNYCEQKNNEDFMVKNATVDDDNELQKRLWEQIYETQTKHDHDHDQHGGGFKIKDKKGNLTDDFWYIIIHSSTGLAHVHTDFPIQDAQHIWVHIDDILGNQNPNASRMTHSNRGYWIALRHQTLRRPVKALETDRIGQTDDKSENEDSSLQVSAESLINQTAAGDTWQGEKLTYLLISKAKRWSSLNETTGKVLRFIDEFSSYILRDMETR
ncbi:Schizosaccharomyces specific protein [Schizosaccharomyces osmophilus]|uniref:Schizosaccharomyces specific protein n=1 Tax=Schizosaccharomyces osmophilus TaxID=2545709 RepID=A0AAE9W5Q5_9SCHI|nr:Schizosaccharomyces specific protein [Schizosaccharomyces osmophilus]WBW70691.1 Schizosaccharomyces specific protein [Schizosaccharomyces osmophilus]